MNIRTIPTLLAWTLCAAACDPTEEPSERAAAVAFEAPAELDVLLPLCEELPFSTDASELPPMPALEFTDAPQVAGTECAGQWELKVEPTECSNCDFLPGDKGMKFNTYRRWCYPPPNPPTCGGCSDWSYIGYQCYNNC